MFTDREVSARVSEVLLAVSAELDCSVEFVASSCSESERAAYQQLVATIMGEICVSGLNLIYRRHPDLKPDEYYLPAIDRG